MTQPTDDLAELAEKMVRDGRGRFVRMACVNAHDRCYLGGPCPWCEPVQQPEKGSTNER